MARLATVLLLTACSQEPPPEPSPPSQATAASESKEEWLFSVDGERYLASGWLRSGREPFANDSTEVPIERRIERALAAREARRRGLEREPAVRDRLRTVPPDDEAARARVLADALRAEVAAGLPVSPDDARAYFEAHANEFTEPQFSYREYAAASEAEAEQIRARSRDPEAAGEPKGPFARADIPKDRIPEVFALREPGDRVALQRDGGWIVLELSEIQPAVPIAFEQAKDEIVARIRALRAAEAYAGLVNRLRAEAEIVVNEEALRKPSPRQREARPGKLRSALEQMREARREASRERAPDASEP